MTLDQFIERYGTRTVPMLLKQLGTHLSAQNYKDVEIIANDLQSTLEDYANSDNFEPPTVNNKVV